MDNASKNAGDMIQKFSLLYNRYPLNITILIIELVKLSLPLNSLISSRVPALFSVKINRLSITTCCHITAFLVSYFYVIPDLLGISKALRLTRLSLTFAPHLRSTSRVTSRIPPCRRARTRRRRVARGGSPRR